MHNMQRLHIGIEKHGVHKLCMVTQVSYFMGYRRLLENMHLHMACPKNVLNPDGNRRFQTGWEQR